MYGIEFSSFISEHVTSSEESKSPQNTVQNNKEQTFNFDHLLGSKTQPSMKKFGDAQV